MKPGPVIHGALLAIALILAYQSWTREKKEDKKLGDVKVWSKSADSLQAISFDTKDKTLRVERKREGSASWLWGTETRVSKVRKPKEGGAPGETDVEDKTVVKEFPVGDSGDELFKNFAELRALRDMGVLDEELKERYGFAESTDNITVSFADGDKSLILGGKIYGGSDRYLLDTTSGKGFAIAGAIVAGLNGGESTLRLSKLHKFDDDKLRQVRIASGGKEITLVRTETMTEKGKTKGWARADSPDKPDQTLANFIDSLKQLRPTGYVAETGEQPLEPLMTAEWLDADGKPLGKLDVWRQVVPPPPEPPAPALPPGGVPPAPPPGGSKLPAGGLPPAGGKPAAPPRHPEPEPDGHTHDPAGGEAKQPAAGVRAPTPPPAKPAPKPTPPKPDAKTIKAPPDRPPGKPGVGTPAKPGVGTPAKPGAPVVVEPPKEEPKPREPTIEYYVKSELTHVYGKIGKGQGERMEKDLKEILQ